MKLISNRKYSKLLKSGAKYSASSSLSSVVTMLVSFVSMRWLGPELLGIWHSLTIVVAYLPFIQLGIQSGLNLELPIELGKGNKAKAELYVAVAKSFAIFLAGLIFIVGIIITVYLFLNGTDPKLFYSSITIVILSITSCFRQHFVATYRSSKSFDRLSKVYFIDSFVNICLIFFIYKYEYYGLLIYYACKEIIATVLMYVYAPYRGLPAHFEKSFFLVLLKRGLFMSVFNQIKSAISSFPRIILLSLGGVVQVGLFSPALSLGHLMLIVPNQLAQFLVPQMGYKYGETGMAKDMWKYLKKITLYMPVIVLPFAVIGWLIMPFVLDYFFPKYLESLWPIRIMMIGFVFSMKLAYNFLITIKAYKETLLLQGVDAVCLILIPYILIKMNVLEMTVGMSVGLSIGYFVSYVVNYFVIKRTVFLEKYNVKK